MTRRASRRASRRGSLPRSSSRALGRSRAGVGSGHRRPAADPAADARASPISRRRCRRRRRAALEAKLADWEARTSQPARRADGADDAAGADRGVLAPRRREVEDRPQGQDNGALFLVAKNDQQDADRGRLRPRGRAARRHVATASSPRTSRRRSARASSPQASTPASTGSSPSSAGEAAAAAQPRRAKVAPRLRLRHRDAVAILFIVVPVVGGILRSMFGRLGWARRSAPASSALLAWLVAGSLADRRHRGASSDSS